MTLKARLEGKDRRREVWRVVVDATAAQAAAVRVQQAASEVEIAALAQDPELLDRAKAAHAAALAELEACFEEVEFVALEPDVYEELLARFIDPAEGELDERAALPALAAACVVDDELHGDEEWWAAALTSGRYTAGEVDQLLTLLVSLNYGVPGPGPGKG